MIRSMTGFGRGTSQDSNRSFVVEIKTVNHRYFDLSVKMPRALVSLEDRIRKVVQEKISRGKVDIFVNQYTYDKQDIQVNVNKTLADSYVKCLEEIKARYDVKDDISVSLVAKFPEVISVEQKEEDLETIWNCLFLSLNESIQSLAKMREREGGKLYEDVTKRCSIIQEMVHQIEKLAPGVVMEYRERLSERIRTLMENREVDENRLAMEVAIFADKASIEEEIVRLYSHIHQFLETLKISEPVGRKLDFIVQEMNREANTIASKTNNLKITNLVLNIKNEIEKIREQVQNIE